MSSGGSSSGSGSSTSLGPPPAGLAWRNGPSLLEAGRCEPVDLVLLDANGGAASAPSPLNIQLRVTPSDLLTIHADSACQTPALQMRVIPGGSGQARLYLRGARPGTAVLDALAPPLTSASLSFPVNAATPNAVVLLGPKVTVAQTECSAPLLLGLLDALGNQVAPQQPTDITLTSNSAGLIFYTDATCNTVAPGGGVVRLPAGASSVQARMRGPTTGTFTVTASAGALRQATQQHEILLLSDPSLLLSGLVGTVVEAGACNALTVERRKDGTELRSATAARVSLATVGAVDVDFHGDAACSGAPVSTVDIPANSGRATIYVRGTRAGALTLTASFASYADGVLPLTVRAGVPARLALPPALTLTAGTCLPSVKTTLVDAFDNPTTSTNATSVTLSSVGSILSVSGGNMCSAAPTVTITAGQTNADISLRSTTVGTYMFSARAPNLQDANANALVLPAPPAMLAVNLPAAVAAGSCSGVLTAELQDNYNNLSPAPGTLTVAFSAAGTAGITFHGEADAACASAGSAPVELPAQQARVRFRVRGVTAGVASATVQVGVLQTSRMVTVSAGAPARLVGPTAAVVLAAGDCVAVPLQVLDAQNNLAPASANTSITLSGPATGPSIHPDAACAQRTAVPLAAGSNTVTVYVSARSGGPYQVTLLSDFPDVPLNVQVTAAVRRVTCLMGANENTASCAVTPPVTSTARAFFMFQATHDAAEVGQGSVRCELESAQQLRCVRGAVGAPVNIEAQVVELPRGTTVQHRTEVCSGAVTAVPLNPAVDASRSFVLWSASSASAMSGASDMATAVLRNNGSAVELTAASCAMGGRFSVQVVTADWARVTRGVVELEAGALSAVVDAPAQDPATSFVLHGWRHNASGVSMCDRMVRGTVENATRLVFSRGVEQGFTCTSPNLTVAYERVTLVDQGRIQHLPVLLFPTVPSAEEALPQAVDASRTLVFSGGQWSNGQASGEGSYDANEVPGMMLGRMSLTGGTSVFLERTGVLGAAAWSVTVLELGL